MSFRSEDETKHINGVGVEKLVPSKPRENNPFGQDTNHRDVRAEEAHELMFVAQSDAFGAPFPTPKSPREIS